MMCHSLRCAPLYVPDCLEEFDSELFCELIVKIIVEDNTHLRFRLKNGLELRETIRRAVR